MASYKENLLIGICSKLQLTPSLYEQAEQRYKTIADIINKDDAFLRINLQMYPHGSFRLKTTVRPLKENEYDLDFVIELPSNSLMMPKELYDHIYRILKSDGIHNDMLEKKTRCIRVNYANDFHMDIMPGKVLNTTTKEIIVPDRDLKNWYHHSNPIGYANWFENQATVDRQKYNKAHFYAKVNAEPLTEQESVRKLEPLRRAVQLVKRYRDIYCDKNNVKPVRSIIICTLMGYISSSYSNEIDIINDFCDYANRKIEENNRKPFEVRNPVVNENLSEKWIEDPDNFNDFVDMIESLSADLIKLKKDELNVDIISHLKKMFGESLTIDVIKEQADNVSLAREAGRLAVKETGILNTQNIGLPVKKNTFYGE